MTKEMTSFGVKDMKTWLGVEKMNWQGPGRLILESGGVSTPEIYFEVSDLVYYYASENTPTGIQRVQQELARALLSEMDNGVIPVIYDRAIQKWRSLSTDWLFSLISAASEFRGSNEAWRVVYQEFSDKLSSFALTQFEKGTWLLNAGASWSLPSYFVQIRQLRRRGVRFATFLHDCIPVRHPAYFEYVHTIEHTYWLAQVHDTADLVICNSQTTRNDYLEFVKPRTVDNVLVCRLDASWVEGASSPKSDMAASELLSDLGIFDDDFVLCVGTIEPRKNHIALVHVWDKLRETHPTNCPKLLCVGRVGWKSDAVISQANALGLMNHQIFFTGALSDDILSILYRKCLFSIYVSYYEGWGLPISESLHLGKVCVAGSNAALREASAGYATHVDERSESAIHEVVARFVDDRAALHAAEARIRSDYRARNWPTIGAGLRDIIKSVKDDGAAPPAFPVMEANTLYQFGRFKPIVNFDRPEAAEIFCVGQAWYQPEDWGCWTSKESAELGFRINKSLVRPTIFLGVLPPPGGANLTISVNGKQLRGFADFGERKIVRLVLDEAASAPGSGQYFPVRIRVTVSRTQDMSELENSTDVRKLGAAFLFVTCFDSSSIMERMEFLEKLLTDDIMAR